MAIGDDVTYDYVNKIIMRAVDASPNIYTTNQLYSNIQDVFDASTEIDDQMAMSAQTPTSNTVINGWYLQEELTQYLSGGAIQTNGYDDEIRTLICGSIGWTNFIIGDIGNTLTGGDTSDTGTILDYTNTDYKIWVRMDDAADLFDVSEGYTQSGSGAATSIAASTTGEHIFSNPKSVGSLEGDPSLFIYQDSNLITSWWNTGHIDILVKVTESGVDIDSKNITVSARQWTDLYSTFSSTLTTAGQDVIVIGTKDDINNTSTEITIENFTNGVTADVSINFSYTPPFSFDVGDGGGVQPYEVQINCDSTVLTTVYEVMKWWTRWDSSIQLQSNQDGSILNGEAYRFAKSTYSEITESPLGTFAGGKAFMARSIYFINLNSGDSQAYQLIDASNNSRIPPNLQKNYIQ